MRENMWNHPKNGMAVMLLTLLLYLASVGTCVFGGIQQNWALLTISIIWLVIGWFPLCGLKVLKPQEALVLTLLENILEPSGRRASTLSTRSVRA